MKTYQLFSEFSNSTIYGNNLPDAIRRAGKLPVPSRYENYQKVDGSGGMVEIGEILGIEDVRNCTRGTHGFEAVVAVVDGRPYRIDAIPGAELIPVNETEAK